MNILVLNPGSSSVKFSLFAADPHLSAAAPYAPDPTSIFEAELSGVGTPSAQLTLPSGSQAVSASTPTDAIHLVLDAVTAPGLPAFDAVGYRVVHPGPHVRGHAPITPGLLAKLDAAIPFAPLHDPEAVEIIRAATQRFPHQPHFACFDTVFHQTMPEASVTYPIPQPLRDQGVRRYGFHGLSCESVVHQLRAATGVPFPQRMIIAHLGSGCSVTAVHDGKSVDTSMGLTPTGGVLMGTRPGDLDPGLIFYLLRQPGASIDSVEDLFNHHSGLKALAGSSDMRTLRQTSSRDRHANLAIEIFTQSIRKTIAGLASIHGMDALVFTGGIGEHDSKTRWATANGLYPSADTPQPEIDFAINETKLSGLRKITSEESNIPVYVVPAEEDLMIAIHVRQMAASNGTG